MFVSGVFNNATTSPSHRAAIPTSFDVIVSNADINVGALMNVADGTYSRRGNFSESGSWYELKWYAHRSLRSLLVLELRVHLVGVDELSLSLESNGDMSSVDFTFEPVHISKGVSTLCGHTNIAETKFTLTHEVCVVSSVIPATLTITKSQSGQVVPFIKAVRTSLDSTSVKENALHDYYEALGLSNFSSLYPTHKEAWDSLWSSGVEIRGRTDVSKAINASLYEILASVREDWPYGLAPGGLTNSYNGHSFWDTETWMYPPLLLLHSEIARSLLLYRFLRLDGARSKALSYDPPFAGAMFPWESAFSGVETCPTFAATGLREDHISGDIAIAVWQEWCARRNTTWLKEIGLPILHGVADFWTSIAKYEINESGAQVAHINDVIPPDEYVDHVNDSVYTNYVAAQSLRFAASASAALGEECSRCDAYRELADNLVILLDGNLGIHPEYSGYRGDIIKQADVVLLHYPLGMDMPSVVQRADLDYYSPRTDTNGPAMTWGMISVGYLDLQEFEIAAKYFNMSFQDNIQTPLPVWTETPHGNAANFITGAGGFLQTVLFGYPGIRLTEDALSMSPLCPENVEYFKIRNLSYLGNSLSVEYFCQNSPFATKVLVTLSAVAKNSAPLMLICDVGVGGTVKQSLVLNTPVELAPAQDDIDRKDRSRLRFKLLQGRSK